MTELTLIAFGGFAVLDWVAVARQWRLVEYLAKPAALGALTLYAAVAPEPSWLLITALVLSLLGDVYLMLPETLFAAGLFAFLLAHIAYIAAFDVSGLWRVLWWLVMLAAAAPVALRILRAVPAPPLRMAIGAYVAVISLMAASAIASGVWIAIAGALLFVVSDGLIAWSRFVSPFAGARLAIIVTYHVGQLGLVQALR